MSTDHETQIEVEGDLGVLLRAQDFARPLISGETLSSGENTWDHAQAVSELVASLGGAVSLQAASYLVYACEHLNKPQEVITKAFGATFAVLAMETTKLVQLQKQSRAQTTLLSSSNKATPTAVGSGSYSLPNQTEAVRRMLMAFSKDL